MNLRQLDKTDLIDVLAGWAKRLAVYLPSAGGVSRLERWDGTSALPERYRNTAVPLKELFLPPAETMFRFHKDRSGFGLEPALPEAKASLVFGVRPCDARALSLVDKLFRDSYEDVYYLSRRQTTLLAGLACDKPYDSCFCTSLGLEPGFSPDVDIMLADAGDAYLVEPVTEQGASLLADLEKAGPDDATRLKDIRQTARRLVSRELETGDISDRVLGVFEDRSFWEKAAAKCLSCGVCTFLCPTCYCFDITDKRSGASGARSRRWDSCAFPEYTRMPAENPREEKWRRVRQRVGHKYVFYPRLFGDIACTGCGRCIRACPVNLDITRLLAGLPARAAVAER